MKNKCKYCGLGCMNTYCNDNCRKKYSYHNNSKSRLAQIERAKSRVEDIRETNKFNKQQEINAKLIKEVAEIDPKVMELYMSIYGKR